MIESVEDAYEAIAMYLRAFIGERMWDRASCKLSVLSHMASGSQWLSFDEKVDELGGFGENPDAMWSGLDAAIFLRDDLLKSTGARIWGLTFVLFPHGGFDISYDYTKPDGYLEDDEHSGAMNQDAPVTNLLGGLVKVGTTGDANESLDSPRSGETLRLRTALAWLQERTAAESKGWALGSEENWNADLDEGWLRWTFADGRVMQAEVQVVGTYNTANGTFLWGWDHPSVPEPLRRAAKLAQALGAREYFLRLTTRTIACTEDEAWQFTALAAKLDDATGAYRGNANGTWVYMAYGRPVAIRESA